MQQADGWQENRRDSRSDGGSELGRPLIHQTDSDSQAGIEDNLWQQFHGDVQDDLDSFGSQSNYPFGYQPISASNPQAGGRIPWLESIEEAHPRVIGLHRNRAKRDLGFPGPGENGEDLAALLHDTRNMIASMDLYCDLLDEPGVLNAPFRHYAGELRLVSGAGRRLLQKLAMLDFLAEDRRESSLSNTSPRTSPISSSSALRRMYRPAAGRDRRQFFDQDQPIENLAGELQANHNLLSALVGPGITVGLSIGGGRRAVSGSIPMTADALTRILINLARNAADAMPLGGHIQIDLEQSPDRLCLTVSDNGPGIPEEALEAVFAAGYSTHVSLDTHFSGEEDEPSPATGWPYERRGLGLSIVRSLVEAADGTVHAADRTSEPRSGAAIVIQFPVKT
jgi:signal transduction histidine kinase